MRITFVLPFATLAGGTRVVATPAGVAPDLIDGTNGMLLPEEADAEATRKLVATVKAAIAHQSAQRDE